jgi:predicted nucleic acid-binding protein
MIVVADTSPLNYLIQIDCDTLPPELYGRIIIPTAVMHELRNAGARERVRIWVKHLFVWLK